MNNFNMDTSRFNLELIKRSNKVQPISKTEFNNKENSISKEQNKKEETKSNFDEMLKEELKKYK